MHVGMRCPGHRVDATFVVVELGDWVLGLAYVDNRDEVLLHRNNRQIIRVLSIPRQPQQWQRIISVIQHRGMLQIPQIELPGTPVGTDGGEDVGCRGERYVVDLFVVRDQLCVHLPFVDVPDRARRVDARGTD